MASIGHCGHDSDYKARQTCDMMEFSLCETKDIVLPVHRAFAAKLFRDISNVMESENVHELRQQYKDNINDSGEAYLDDIPCLWHFGRRLMAFRGPAMALCPQFFGEFIEEICGIYPILLRFDGERKQFLVRVVLETTTKHRIHRESALKDSCEWLDENADELDVDEDVGRLAVDEDVERLDVDNYDDNRRFSEFGDRKCRRVEV